jgi:hypothetical protein
MDASACNDVLTRSRPRLEASLPRYADGYAARCPLAARGCPLGSTIRLPLGTPEMAPEESCRLRPLRPQVRPG